MSDVSAWEIDAWARMHRVTSKVEKRPELEIPLPPDSKQETPEDYPHENTVIVIDIVS